MTVPTFDTHTAVRRLRSTGMEEQTAEGVVEIVDDATNPLVTGYMLKTELAGLKTELAGLRADMYRALWIQGVGIVAVVGGIVGIAEVIN